MEQKGGLYVDLEVLEIEGLSNIYAVDAFRKEFIKAVHENWKNSPPFERSKKTNSGFSSFVGGEGARN